MMIKRIIKRLLGEGAAINSFRGVYASFEEASKKVPASRRIGYDVPETADWYRKQLDEIQHDDYPMLFWFERLLNDANKIVEIGGHVGVAYYPITKVLQCRDALQWTIVDVPSVTRAGADLARERGCRNLHFVNELADAGTGCDALLASGSLQYLPGPLLPERVSAMSPLPKHIIINKTPVRKEGSGYVTLQNIGVSLCPYRIHSHEELIAALERMGYQTIATWRKDREVLIPGRPDLRVDAYCGYYLRLASHPQPAVDRSNDK